MEEDMKKDLMKLFEMTNDTVKAIKAAFPGREIRIKVEEGEDSFWIDDCCYSREERFYFPN